MSPICALVPTPEVISLAQELSSLGSHDVRIGNGWAGAVVPPSAVAVGLVEPTSTLCCCSTAEAQVALVPELAAWQSCGFTATLLLQHLPAAPVLEAVAAKLQQEGATVGLSWRLLPPPQQQLEQRPSSRLGSGRRDSSSDHSHCYETSATVGITSLEQLHELLAAAEQQQQAAQIPAHLLFILHTTHAITGALSRLYAVELHAGPEKQIQQALLLLREVAALHQSQRTGKQRWD